MTLLSLTGTALFAASAALAAYAYIGYPRVLALIAKIAGVQPVRDPLYRPMVSIVVPAYNEEKVIARKIENSLALDYPKDLLEVVICSDCSSDRTSEIVNSYKDPRIVFYDHRERRGKTGMLNLTVPHVRGEIVVLTDANVMLSPDAVSKAVSLYSSPEIGVVIPQVNLFVPEGGVGTEKEIAYRKFEARLKYHEGLFGATLGAFGGFYTIRRDLFEPLPDNAYSNDDFIIPTRIVMKGYKAVFDRESMSLEDTARTVEDEFNRRVRIGAGSYQSFSLLKGLLSPKNGMAAFFYFSHKVLRWFSPWILLGVLLGNILALDEPVMLIVCILQGVFYSLSGVGALFARKGIVLPVLTPIYHFVSMNLAYAFGWFRFVNGIRSAAWQSTART